MSFTGEVAVIESAFGTTGKFRLTVPSKIATFIHIHTVLLHNYVLRKSVVCF